MAQLGTFPTTMSDLKRKLKEVEVAAAADEAEIARLEKSRKLATEEVARLKREVVLEDLRLHVASIKEDYKDSSITSDLARLMRITLLINRAIQSFGKPRSLVFTLPLGIYDDTHDYYDTSQDMYSFRDMGIAEEQKRLFVKATWSWDGPDHVAQIFSDGTVTVVGYHTYNLKRKVSFNVFNESPENWTLLMEKGKFA